MQPPGGLSDDEEHVIGIVKQHEAGVKTAA
jgi:hypothetical protein